jgi:hypothetical protein
MKKSDFLLKNTSDYDDNILYGIEEKLEEASVYAMDTVNRAFEGADVDLQARKIIWSDGRILTIEQSAQKISKQSGVDNTEILNQIICWLTMDFVPKGLNQEQMSSFEDQMEEWIKNEHFCNQG